MWPVLAPAPGSSSSASSVASSRGRLALGKRLPQPRLALVLRSVAPKPGMLARPRPRPGRSASRDLEGRAARMMLPPRGLRQSTCSRRCINALQSRTGRLHACPDEIRASSSAQSRHPRLRFLRRTCWRPCGRGPCPLECQAAAQSLQLLQQMAREDMRQQHQRRRLHGKLRQPLSATAARAALRAAATRKGWPSDGECASAPAQKAGQWSAAALHQPPPIARRAVPPPPRTRRPVESRRAPRRRAHKPCPAAQLSPSQCCRRACASSGQA
mmetsp:Transcript_8892/g.27583  ORF Transcript_8892/g.27583 Transcript_8892/m.27583 type:complete len:271 (+) Transcript_8892:608-1420(+)